MEDLSSSWNNMRQTRQKYVKITFTIQFNTNIKHLTKNSYRHKINV